MPEWFRKRGDKILGVDKQSAIKAFFGSNAVLSIAILLSICGFLAWEAAQFFPKHHRELGLYRKTGQEYVDFLKSQVDGYTKLNSKVAQGYFAELEGIAAVERGITDGFWALVDLAEEEGESEIEALALASDNLDAAEGDNNHGKDEDACLALQEAKEAWLTKLSSILKSADRLEIDPFGRLADENWHALLDAMPQWDPVEGEPPSLVTQAERHLDAKMAEFAVAKDAFTQAGSDLRAMKERLREKAMEVKSEAIADQTAAARKAALLAGARNPKTPDDKRESLRQEAAEIVVRDAFPFAERVQFIYDIRSEHMVLAAAFKEKFSAALGELPKAPGDPIALQKLNEVRKESRAYLADFDALSASARHWRHDVEYSWRASIAAFFFGRDWVTNSSWHDFFGLMPLLSGSLVISIIALTVAVPFSIGAAIYVNQLATPFERTTIKPAIEFVQAIPSVVLGFFGIMVLGTFLRDVSQIPWLAWIPGFPMQERLNMINAGLLLALMAVPTIFTLCEDALNNVPKAFSESSLALGASKLQTILRVVVPAAVSGIIAAILLGFGRIIGETMVVLLVAGNKIAIPDLSAGLGVVTQPAHTMTGIIAQETGEVDQGSLHWRALFMVGLILFTISLGINYLAQRIISRFKFAS